MINSAEEFLALRKSDVKSEYDRATFDDAPLSVWNDILNNHPDYAKWVAHNRLVPLEILERLCEFDTDTRVFLAMKRRLSPVLFDRLSRDVDAVVRQQIAANKKTPLDIIINLVNDADEDVARVAKHAIKTRS